MEQRMATIVSGDPGAFTPEIGEKIKAAYNCLAIREGWIDTDTIAPGDLILTYDKTVLTRAGRIKGRFGFPLRIVTYSVAMEMVKIDEEGRAGISR